MKNSLVCQKLEEARRGGIKLIAVDYDGTVYDRNDKNYNSLDNVIELAFRVFQSGISFAFVSGRNTTLDIKLREMGLRFCRKNNCSFVVWRSGGTGAVLNKLTFNPKEVFIEKIYSNSFDKCLLEKVLDIYRELKINPDLESKKFFNEFLKNKPPEDLMPEICYKISCQSKGSVFAEAVKVTFVLPSNIDEQKKTISILRKKLDSYDLCVSWGNLPFADVGRNLRIDGKIIDGKLYMMKNLVKELKIKDNHLVTFGDSPNDNNKGLLSYPYSFTNDSNVIKSSVYTPPYVLEIKESSVGAVYEAINYLIKK
jgi:hydroxymethylpyrimidine pyrophosphatase-like HAD family hydrolase